MILDATGAAQPTGAVTGELVAGGTVAWTPDGRKLLYLVREEGDSQPAGRSVRSMQPAAASRPLLVRGVQSFDIGWPRP